MNNCNNYTGRLEDESPRYVLNDIALIQIVEKKPKSASEFALVAGGALSPVAKAHAAEAIAIIRNLCNSGQGCDTPRDEGQRTPAMAVGGGGSLLLEV
jgi:ribonuclease D